MLNFSAWVKNVQRNQLIQYYNNDNKLMLRRSPLIVKIVLLSCKPSQTKPSKDFIDKIFLNDNEIFITLILIIIVYNPLVSCVH